MRLRLMLTTSVNTFFFCTTSFVGWSCYIDRYMLDTFFLFQASVDHKPVDFPRLEPLSCGISFRYPNANITDPETMSLTIFTLDSYTFSSIACTSCQTPHAQAFGAAPRVCESGSCEPARHGPLRCRCTGWSCFRSGQRRPFASR